MVTTQNMENSPFLALPYYLREIIYVFVLLRASLLYRPGQFQYDGTRHLKHCREIRQVADNELALFRVNRFISSEALIVFYRKNKFCFEVPPLGIPQTIINVPQVFQQYLRRVFLTVQVEAANSISATASSIRARANDLVQIGRHIATSPMVLETLMIMFYYHRDQSGNHQKNKVLEQLAREILKQANQDGFFECRKDMADGKGTLSVSTSSAGLNRLGRYWERVICPAGSK